MTSRMDKKSQFFNFIFISNFTHFYLSHESTLPWNVICFHICASDINSTNNNILSIWCCCYIIQFDSKVCGKENIPPSTISEYDCVSVIRSSSRVLVRFKLFYTMLFIIYFQPFLNLLPFCSFSSVVSTARNSILFSNIAFYRFVYFFFFFLLSFVYWARYKKIVCYYCCNVVSYVFSSFNQTIRCQIKVNIFIASNSNSLIVLLMYVQIFIHLERGSESANRL